MARTASMPVVCRLSAPKTKACWFAGVSSCGRPMFNLRNVAQVFASPSAAREGLRAAGLRVAGFTFIPSTQAPHPSSPARNPRTWGA